MPRKHLPLAYKMDGVKSVELANYCGVRLNTRGPRKYYAKPYDTGISSACLGDVIDGISDSPSLLCYCKALTVVADVKHDFFS